MSPHGCWTPRRGGCEGGRVRGVVQWEGRKDWKLTGDQLAGVIVS